VGRMEDGLVLSSEASSNTTMFWFYSLSSGQARTTVTRCPRECPALHRGVSVVLRATHRRFHQL
jgi:hypothetical protein